MADGNSAALSYTPVREGSRPFITVARAGAQSGLVE